MTVHIPVMLDEVLGHLDVREGGRYVDGTLGGGGHSEVTGKHGVMLAMENHDFTTDIDRYLEIVEAIDSPWFGANLDTGNLAKTDDPYRELARIAPYTVNAQFKMHIPVDGKKQPADFDRLVKILRDAGYRGYVVLEYEEKEDPMIAIPKVLNQLRELI